jgi:hypothetical protein
VSKKDFRKDKISVKNEKIFKKQNTKVWKSQKYGQESQRSKNSLVKDEPVTDF